MLFHCHQHNFISSRTYTQQISHVTVNRSKIMLNLKNGMERKFLNSSSVYMPQTRLNLSLSVSIHQFEQNRLKSPEMCPCMELENELDCVTALGYNREMEEKQHFAKDSKLVRVIHLVVYGEKKVHFLGPPITSRP